MNDILKTGISLSPFLYAVYQVTMVVKHSSTIPAGNMVMIHEVAIVARRHVPVTQLHHDAQIPVQMEDVVHRSQTYALHSRRQPLVNRLGCGMRICLIEILQYCLSLRSNPYSTLSQITNGPLKTMREQLPSLPNQLMRSKQSTTQAGVRSDWQKGPQSPVSKYHIRITTL